MFDQATLRTSIKFGVLSALASFAMLLILYFSGINPFGSVGVWSLIFTPVFVFWSLGYYKKYSNQAPGFLKALKVGWATAFYTALCSGMLVFVFATLAGQEVISRHIAEMKAILDAGKQAALDARLFTRETYNDLYTEIEKTTPYTLAVDDFSKKLITGFLAGIVAAVFFRK